MNNNVNEYKNHSRSGSHNTDNQNSNSWLIVGGIIVVVLIILIVVVNVRKNKPQTSNTITETVSESETFDDSRIRHDYEIDLSNVPGLKSKSLTVKSGMNKTEILKSFKKLYNWDVVVVNNKAETGNVVKPTVDANETTAVGNGDTAEESSASTEEIAALKEIVVKETISMPDYLETAAIELINKIFDDDKKVSNAEYSMYQLELSGLDTAIEQFAQNADDMWYVEPKGGSIESYDAEKDEFLMEGSSIGCKVDKEKLIKDLKAQLNKGNYDCSIPVKTEEISSENSVENGEYTIIAKYVTKTTDNSVRNKNVRLACEKLNGTIIRPGEEFSYNYAIGERTEAKGYGIAAAYANGEVVQEVGGGVCQVSSTLYNAITEAGLKTTYRSPHTFKPTYVTPGQDATISWGGPDYRFANVIALPDISYDNTYAIGIRAVYKDRTVTVTIYGRPVLKPGYKVTMESEMTAEVEVVRETIPEGSDKEPTEGDKGSTWKTYLHITKDDQEVSRDLYHNTVYKGHTEYYFETESTEESSESFIPSGPGDIRPTTAITSDSSEANSGSVVETSSVSENSSAEPQIIDSPSGIPGATDSTTSSGPQIIQDGP